MKIIVLNGKANCGKTTVLKKLYAKLVANNLFRQTHFQQEGLYDLSAIFEYDVKKVGVTTLGDGETELQNAFNLFIKENCDLVVCASRSRATKNGAVRYIKSLKADLIWYKKAYIEQWLAKYDANTEIDVINDIQAKVLLEEILLHL